MEIGMEINQNKKALAANKKILLKQRKEKETNK